MNQYIGKILDNRYEILDVIGVGGMAVVYKAYCHRLHRFVAIKILKRDLAADAEFRRRFHEEAQAVAVLPPKVETVWETVKTLKPMDRGALYLFYYEGYSTGEIAQMLRVSQSSVTSRLSRARKKLKEQLEQEGYHETGV